MDSMDNFRKRFEALERRTQMVEQRLRWWRGLACGVVVLALLSLALPSGKAADPQPGGMAERMATLEKKLTAMDFDDVANEVIIKGANLRIVNGLGTTDTTNGLGNLIVGYNELRQEDPDCPRVFGTCTDTRTGSHNVVVGKENNFSRFGGVVVGLLNEISGDFTSVSGGRGNTATGTWSSISGGTDNTANGFASAVSAGLRNTASGDRSAACGGVDNTASGPNSSVSGGTENTASGTLSAVSGGRDNTASGYASVVSAGFRNIASGDTTISGGHTAVSGGTDNTASGNFSSVSGGTNVSQETRDGWAAGSFGDEISGSFRSP